MYLPLIAGYAMDQYRWVSRKFPRMITEFIADKLNNSDIIFIDPEKANSKDIHIYQKAGFEKIDEFTASWHPVPHVLMRLKQ